MSTWVVMIIKKVDIETYSKLWGHQSGRLLMFRLSQRTRWKHKQFLIKLQRKNPRRLFIFSFLGTIFSYICLVTYGHGWSTATILLLSRSVNYKMASFIKLSLHHQPHSTPYYTQPVLQVEQLKLWYDYTNYTSKYFTKGQLTTYMFWKVFYLNKIFQIMILPAKVLICQCFPL